MSKNLVICFDIEADLGMTGRRTNVIKLYHSLPHDTHQVTCYLPARNSTIRESEGDAKALLKALAHLNLADITLAFANLFIHTDEFARLIYYTFGQGIREQVIAAYNFLVDNYEDDDRVFLFGAGHAAYVAFLVATFTHSFGLIEARYKADVPGIFRYYAKDNLRTQGRKASQLKPEFFKSTFSRSCRLEFLGFWDMVEPGWIYRTISLPGPGHDFGVRTVRHAVSIDERRHWFRNILLGDQRALNIDFREVWFAGAHSDVVGGYPEPESGLSQLALEWLLGEASVAGLRIDARRGRVMLGLEKGCVPGLQDLVAPSATAPLHSPLRGLWWEFEVLPQRYRDPLTGKVRLIVPMGRRREIPDNSYVHRSVLERMEHLSDYKPANLPSRVQIAETIPFIHGAKG